MSYFTTGGPGKEHGTNKPPPTRRIQERSGGDASLYVLRIFQNPSRWNPPWLSDACATRKDPESEWLTRDNPETNPITIKPTTASHVAEQSSWVLLPTCSPPGCPFPIKSLALSARVSPRTIHFRVLDKSPLSGPGRGPPFLQQLWYDSLTKVFYEKDPRNSHLWEGSPITGFLCNVVSYMVGQCPGVKRNAGWPRQWRWAEKGPKTRMPRAS